MIDSKTEVYIEISISWESIDMSIVILITREPHYATP